MAEAQLRIGELSRRVGATPETLRAWEARYDVVRPKRSAGGLRLYSAADERRLRRMVEYIASGVPASEAARLAKLEGEAGPREPRPSLPDIHAALDQSFRTLDEPLAQSALDRLMGTVSLQSALSDVILPFLRMVGERWATGQATVAHEHFTSNVIGGRLQSIASGWGNGIGSLALLACPPEERHELGLLCFGLALREQGWRIAYLGGDTPLPSIAQSIRELSPTIVVLSATTPERFHQSGQEIGALTRLGRVAIGGAGATDAVAGTLGVELLAPDVITAASSLRP
jgi:DNA-binding transcriptional MerR regulator